MKNEVKSITPNILWCAILVGLVIFTIPVLAQNTSEINNNVLPTPSEEVFQKADALAVPKRSSGCHSNTEHDEPNCYQVKAAEWLAWHELKIYDENALIWYQFSVSPKSPDHFYEKRKKSFLPFGTGFEEYHPKVLLLRLVGESENWFKVEVNEETQATEYILKSDPMWAKSNWSYWLFFEWSIGVDVEKSPLHDKPDGKIIKGLTGGSYNAGMVKKVDGEWVNVDMLGSGYKLYNGWVRWKNGRKILVKLAIDVAGGLPAS